MLRGHLREFLEVEQHRVVLVPLSERLEALPFRARLPAQSERYIPSRLEREHVSKLQAGDLFLRCEAQGVERELLPLGRVDEEFLMAILAPPWPASPDSKT